MRKALFGLGVFTLAMPLFAAVPINLNQQPASILVSPKLISSTVTIAETSRLADFNQTLHVRIQQLVRGYSVWGADAVVHIPHAGQSKQALSALLGSETTLNGMFYNNLEQDLAHTPASVFSAQQKQNAIDYMARDYQSTRQQANLIVYVDANKKARWAFHVSFFVPARATGAAAQKPAFIIDAENFNVYQHWNDLKTLDNVEGGGFGGNHKLGKKTFDGLTGHAMKLRMQRDAAQSICHMKNDFVTVKDARKQGDDMTFVCKKTNPNRNNIYWNSNHDQVETTWSPSNDALYGADITSGMFHDWYKMPVLQENGQPMHLPLTVHNPMVNAYWDSNQVVFGDSIGSDRFNPFTQLDTVGHEICHGFTEQHSNLYYYSESGGLNEAFSDMAGIAAEYYAYGKTKFLVGWGDVKAEGKALRYMEKPSKDCDGRAPGDNCSIDNMSQMSDDIDVHYTSGIFNRAFYLLATTPGWDAHKAFDVMVQANLHYWTSNTTFFAAACGVMHAAKDYKYNQDEVANVFKKVGLPDMRFC